MSVSETYKNCVNCKYNKDNNLSLFTKGRKPKTNIDLPCIACRIKIRLTELKKTELTKEQISEQIKTIMIERKKEQATRVRQNDRCSGCGRHDDFCRCGGSAFMWGHY